MVNCDCIFCKIGRGEVECNIVYEDQNIICFLDMDPINEGHILIVTKKHFLDVDEIPDCISVEIMRVSQRIIKALRKVYQMDGYSIMQNGGVFNDVGHYHMHLFPRYHGDGFGWTSGKDIPSACNQEAAMRIKNALLLTNN